METPPYTERFALQAMASFGCRETFYWVVKFWIHRPLWIM